LEVAAIGHFLPLTEAAFGFARHSRESGRLFHGRMSGHPVTLPFASIGQKLTLA
jgi:hypothetical protein